MSQKTPIDEEEFTRLWLVENLDRHEMAEHFHCSTGPIDKMIRKLGLKKTKEQIDEVTKRRNRTKWGADYPMQTKGLQDKREQTFLDRYGVSGAGQIPEAQEKQKKTWRERYGAEENPEGLRQLVEKRRQTSLERYGVSNPSQNPEILAKAHQTSIERYGSPNNFSSAAWRERAAEAAEKKTGYRNVFNNPEFQRKLRSYSEETHQILSSPKLLEEYIVSSGLRTSRELAQSLGCPKGTLTDKIGEYNLWHLIDFSSSAPEREVGAYLDSLGVKHRKSRDILFPYEIDLYCPDYNIGIEFNGTYWHSDKVKSHDYHQKKSLMAEQKGVFLFHIFEHEWEEPAVQEKIKEMLRNLFQKNQRHIHARNCEVRVISSVQKASFLKANHFQGNDHAKVALGLFAQGELVAVMTFCQDRFAHKRRCDWELSRFCSLRDTSVSGGASKLFKYFLTHYEGSIVSYSNIARTRGELYRILGFEFAGITKPDYVWVHPESLKVLTRYQTQMKNEIQTMTERGYLRVFGCGNKIWVYKR